MEVIFGLFTQSENKINLLVFIVLGMFLIEELVFLFLKRSRRKKDKEKLKIFRIFIRFFLAYVLARISGFYGTQNFPQNLYYDIPATTLLIAGIITTSYLVAKKLMHRLIHTGRGKKINRELSIIPHKGIRTILFLLSLSLIIWTTVAGFPKEMRNTSLFRIALMFCGIIISGTIFLVLRKSFSSLSNIIEKKHTSMRFAIVVKSLSVPFQILIADFMLFWVKSVISENSLVYNYLDKGNSILFLAALLIFIFRFIEMYGSKISIVSEEETNNLDKSLVEMVRMLLRITLCLAGIFGFFRIITGKPLTTLLAGLGIGGLALALAAQDTLKNFFGSLMIMTDKPFKIGERILVDDYDGVVESIGFRSTKIRTLVGHMVTIPNDQIATHSVENIGRRPHIRRLTNITIRYSTSPVKMEQALTIIKDLLDQHEGMSNDFPPRVYFNEFNDDSLNIMMIYWYSPANYWDYMSFSEKINLQIMKSFDEEGIEFAFPTNTTYLEQPAGKSLSLELNGKIPSHNDEKKEK